MQDIQGTLALTFLDRLSLYKKERFEDVLEELSENQFISGILLGGSVTYKQDISRSDIDLFCLVNSHYSSQTKILASLNTVRDIDVIINQGYFLWTGFLHTIYFREDKDFSIDICLVNQGSAENFFWEPDGIILSDKMGTIARCLARQTENPHFSKQAFLKDNPFSLSVIALKKISKGLARGNLWNSLEQLSIFRRYLMQIVRLYVLKDTDFLGRVDRDIEGAMPLEMNREFAQTAASYDISDIARKTVNLIEIVESFIEYVSVTGEIDFQEWVLLQLQHEKNKLIKYI